MAQYQYLGRDRTGRQRKGRIAGNSRRDVILKLRERGIAVSELHELKDLLHKEITLGRPVKFRQFVIYLRQFSTLLQAGVTVVDATHVLAAQTENKVFRKTLETVEEDLRGGRPLSQAAAKFPRIFPPIFTHMVQAGEIAGSMDETLNRLAVYFEKQHRTRQKIVSALAYPIVVSIIATGVIIFLLTKVVPTFANMFKGFGAELPAVTQLVLHASGWMGRFWWTVILAGILMYTVVVLVRRTPIGRWCLDYMNLKIPLVGRLLQKAAIARMAGTLSSLFSSSVPILQAISIVEKVVENEVIAKVLHESRASLEKGRPLSEPMRQHWVFPPLVTQMIAIGEQTGSLDLMLGKVADFYEAEVEAAADQLKSLIEPLMIVLLAMIVGTIVTSILVPMFDIFNHIQP